MAPGATAQECCGTMELRSKADTTTFGDGV